MKIADLVDILETIAPARGAEDWDNVGLLVGDAAARLRRVLLTIDLTEAVLDEAVHRRADAIVAYHPPIFAPVKRLTTADHRQRVVLRAAQAGIAVHSPHTALDAAPGGLNDWLADACGRGSVRALHPSRDLPRGETHKLVTFVPPSAADAVRDALDEAGAGRIGDYRLCSFEIAGTGTFHGGAGTHPAVGRAGRLERVDELRLEMVCPAGALAEAVAAIRAAHPYEEPPIEVYALEPRPDRTAGAGRLVELDAAVTANELVKRVCGHLGVAELRVGAAAGAARRIRRVGLCAGAGGSLLDAAIGAGADAFLTGEMRYHDVLDAGARGCRVLLAGHSNTERGYLKVLRRRLARVLAGVEIAVSRRDRYPLEVMGP